MTFEMPMFPLGAVLFPGGTLPLHIFEPRFQQLLNHALEGDRRFGVVLIARGSEVGGGEERTMVGTIAEIQQYQRFDDGRAAVVSEGVGRIEVDEWLEDDPYPRAMVTEIVEPGVEPRERTGLEEAKEAFGEILELGQRIGRIEAVPEMEWHEGVDEALWQLATRAPLSAHDQFAVLSGSSRMERVDKIKELLAGVHQDLALMEGLG